MPYIQGETLRTKLDHETQLGIVEAGTALTAVGDVLENAPSTTPPGGVSSS